MKRFRSTGVLAVFVAALAGYTFWEFKNANQDLDEAKGESMAFSLKREDVTEVQLTTKDQTVVLAKAGDEWKVLKPVEDQGDLASIEGFLYSLLSQKLRTFRGEDESKAIDWAAFGLDAGTTVIQVKGKSGAPQLITVSAKNAFDGSYYVRQKDAVYLGDRGLAGLIAHPPESFRSRRLWRAEDATVTRVEVDNGHERFSLHKEKDKDEWGVDPKPGFPIDASKVSTWVKGIEDLSASDVVKEGIDEKDKTEYLLKKPSLTVAVSYKKQDGAEAHWILTVGQDKGAEAFVYTDQRPTIYKMAKSAADHLRVDKSYFRDGHTPFKFDIELAREVRVHGHDGIRVFKKADHGWVLDGNPSEWELDQDKLIQLMQNIQALEAVEFIGAPVAKTGIKSAPEVEVRDDHGKVLFSLAWGDEFKSKNIWNTGASLRYTKTNLERDTLGVAKDKLDRLMDATMVRKKVAPPLPVKAENKSEKAPEKK